jgi:metal-responsive CopG/Arc/MetJ family transcriptional regulator
MQGQFSERVMVNLTAEQREGLDDVAYEKSDPGQRVSRSSVVREAVAEYLDEGE